MSRILVLMFTQLRESEQTSFWSLEIYRAKPGAALRPTPHWRHPNSLSTHSAPTLTEDWCAEHQHWTRANFWFCSMFSFVGEARHSSHDHRNDFTLQWGIALDWNGWKEKPEKRKGRAAAEWWIWISQEKKEWSHQQVGLCAKGPGVGGTIKLTGKQTGGAESKQTCVEQFYWC